MLRSCTLFITALLALSSCFLQKHARSTTADEAQPAVRKERVRKERPRRTSPFQYGRTRDSVLAYITDRSEIIVAEFNKPQGRLAVYQYYRYGKSRSKDPGYYLYFMNDTLIRKSEPEDLEEGAAKAVNQYYEDGQ